MNFHSRAPLCLQFMFLEEYSVTVGYVAIACWWDYAETHELIQQLTINGFCDDNNGRFKITRKGIDALNNNDFSQ